MNSVNNCNIKITRMSEDAMNIFILSFSSKYYSKEIMWTITEREK
jgi:hypothetical protein